LVDLGGEVGRFKDFYPCFVHAGFLEIH
jgi:hypothetical protein